MALIFKRLKKILILVFILAMPGFLYYLLKTEGKNRYKPLPFFGPKHLSGTYHSFHGKKIPDTIYHQVNNFKLTAQLGRPVTFQSLNGKILVVNFFYTHCPGCATVMANVDTLANFYKKNKLVTFVSITVDPARDSPGILKSYAAQFKMPYDKWRFLTGDTTVIYTLARNGLLVDAVQNDKDNFVYSNMLILVDPEHRIRGYYQAADRKEINRLGDELKVQIAEELRKVKVPESY